MSQSIAIPSRRGKQAIKGQPEDSASSSSSTSFSSQESSSSRAPIRDLAPATAPSPSESPYLRDRRPPLLSKNLAAAEYAVINVGTPEAPRLITCVKSSQGFDWNLEMFLPSYIDYDFIDLEHKQDPVEDIILTQDELDNMLPS